MKHHKTGDIYMDCRVTLTFEARRFLKVKMVCHSRVTPKSLPSLELS